jgi:hypothetical protein
MPSFTGSSANQPVIEFRASTTPFATLASLALTGSGYAGAIPLGQSSSIATLRIYNNFANAGSIHDAFDCVLASYDDASTWSSAVTVPVTQLWLSVEVQNYNGSTTGADSSFDAIGGQDKHAVPTNGGTIAGATASYITVALFVTVPATATASSVTQGLWLEYNWV